MQRRLPVRMEHYKVTRLLNQRWAPVNNTEDKSTVVATVKKGFVFDCTGSTVNDLGVWYRDRNNLWYWGGGVEKLIAGSSPALTEDIEYKLSKGNWWINDYGINKIWEKTRGAGVKVAVIDTGLNYNHSNIRNKKNITYYNVVKDLHDKESCFADGQHGTMCAGMIGAQGPDVYGVAPEADLIILKATKAGDLDFSNLVKAINKAVQLGADIISISYSLQFSDKTNPVYIALYEAVKSAVEQNIVIVCSSGDSRSSKERYPASFGYCLSVGGVKRDKSLSDFTINVNTDILAPANDLLLLHKENTVLEQSGTSFSAPFVAGVCALYFSMYGKKNTAELINILKDSSLNKDFIANEVNSKYNVSVPNLGIINPHKLFNLS